MGRPKTIKYDKTMFAIRIGELQKEYGYTDEYVIQNIVDDMGNKLINDMQVLGSYKSGKRMPRDFYDVLKAFSKFYTVTTDYLIGTENTKNHQIKHISEVTGLSDTSIRKLIKFNNEAYKYPGILDMIDAIISGTSDEDITYYLNIYTQIYKDYKDAKSAISDSSYDIGKMQHRFLLTQSLYSYWKDVVTSKLSARFDEEILTEQNGYSEDFIDSIIAAEAEFQNINSILEYEDGTIEVLKKDRY